MWFLDKRSLKSFGCADKYLHSLQSAFEKSTKYEEPGDISLPITFSLSNNTQGEKGEEHFIEEIDPDPKSLRL